MMTTSRSNARIRRTPKFKLEYLDDRIVPSTIGALSHDTSHVATLQVRPEAKTPLAHEPALARLEARDEAKLAASNPTASVPVDALPVKKPPVLIPRKLPVGDHPLVVGARLQSLYAQYVTYVISGASTSFSPTGVSGAVVAGTDVGIKVQTSDHANFKTSLTQLQGDGLQVTQDFPASGVVEGLLPIAQLPAVANNATTVSVTLPSNVGAQLQSVYAQYEAFLNAGGKGFFLPTGVNGLVINDTSVGVNIHDSDAATFKTILAELQTDGLQVTDDSAAYGIIDGMLPIGQLPTVANISPTLSISPMLKPIVG